MKVIFLDIDGVLNCDKTPNPRDFPYIVDKKLLARFRKLLERTGAKVVLTSSWRCDPVGLFAAKHYGVPFIDICPDVHEHRRHADNTWREISAHTDGRAAGYYTDTVSQTKAAIVTS